MWLKIKEIDDAEYVYPYFIDCGELTGNIPITDSAEAEICSDPATVKHMDDNNMEHPKFEYKFRLDDFVSQVKAIRSASPYTCGINGELPGCLCTGTVSIMSGDSGDYGFSTVNVELKPGSSPENVIIVSRYQALYDNGSADALISGFCSADVTSSYSQSCEMVYHSATVSVNKILSNYMVIQGLKAWNVSQLQYYGIDY
jgi:hypothetical protein